jgi:hypothetical protein
MIKLLKTREKNEFNLNIYKKFSKKKNRKIKIDFFYLNF